MRILHPESNRCVLAWLALTTLLCYANALHVPFHFDDYNVIVNNPRVHSWANWLEGFTLGIRPLLKLTYLLNWSSEVNVFAFHLTNSLIHLANAYLVYLLAHAFIQQQAQADKLAPVPFVAALLFAVHPIHTEAVTYICGRSTSLMALFYLAGLHAYVSGRLQQSSLKVYALTPLFFVFALSVKETAVTFPLALLLWELTCSGNWQRALKPLWPSLLVLVLGALFFLFSNSYLSQIERSAQLNSLQGNAATQLSAFLYLMQQWALPLWLNIDPDIPLQHDFPGNLSPLIFFVSASAFVLVYRRQRPWISFALVWAMLQLIPLHVFLPRLDIANERQMYLAGWPLLLALCIELFLLLSARWFRVAVVMLTLVGASLTVMRNQTYASEISLWEDTVKKSPDKARVHNNLGYAYLQEHRYSEARWEFNVALQIDPRLYKARYNLYRVDDEMNRESRRPP